MCEALNSEFLSSLENVKKKKTMLRLQENYMVLSRNLYLTPGVRWVLVALPLRLHHLLALLHHEHMSQHLQPQQ